MRKTLLTLVVMGIVAAPAAAADLGFSVGLTLGITSVNVPDFDPDFGGLRFKEEAFGYQLFAGYRPLKYFAVEAAYTDFGNVQVYEGGNANFYKEANVDISMWSGYAVGLVPMSEKVDFFAKLGYASWNNDNTVISGDQSEDRSTSGSDVAWGLGFNFRFNKLGARIAGDWLQIPDTGGAFMISGGLMYNF